MTVSSSEGEELLVFDTDYMRKTYYVLSNCCLLVSNLCRGFRSVYFTNNPEKICVCDILVVECDIAPQLPPRARLPQSSSVIYTDLPFTSLEKFIGMKIDYPSVVIDIRGYFIILRRDMLRITSQHTARGSFYADSVRSYIQSALHTDFVTRRENEMTVEAECGASDRSPSPIQREEGKCKELCSRQEREMVVKRRALECSFDDNKKKAKILSDTTNICFRYGRATSKDHGVYSNSYDRIFSADEDKTVSTSSETRIFFDHGKKSTFVLAIRSNSCP